MDPKGLHKIQEKAPDRHLVPAVTKRPGRRGGGNLRASTPPRHGPAAHRCTDRPRPHAARLGSRTPAWGSGATLGKGPRGEAGPQPDPRRARVAGVARRKDARGGAAVGEGSPARTLTHRLALLPGRAPRRSPLRLSTARVSSRGSASSRDARSCG